MICPKSESRESISSGLGITRQWLYYNRTFNERVYQMPRIFPMGDAEAENRVIMIKQRQHEGSQFALMVNGIPELQTDGGTQCFPEHLYEADTSIGTEQNRTEQNRTEQNRTEQNRTEQNNYTIH